ncbi:MAG: hypothetical protein ABF257_09040 [Polaribacter sp.]
MKAEKKHSILWGGVLLLTILISSCQDETRVDKLVTSTQTTEVDESEMQLGEQLENPYSVNNMKKALANLTGNTSTSNAKIAKMVNVAEGTNTEELITTTHYYLKFKPKTEEELDLIKSDTTLYWFDHPLDYEITEGDGTYRDPEVPEDQPTYQYTYATIDHVLPETVEYEILEELFVPEEPEEEDIEDSSGLNEEEQTNYEQKLSKVQKAVVLKTEESNNDILAALEEEALRITGNLDQDTNLTQDKTTSQAKTDWWRRPSKWRPSGKITVWDTEVNERDGGYIGIKGIKVRLGNWFKWRTAFTDANGNFRSGTRYRYSVRYKMDWERHQFALRDGGFSSAQYRGPYKRGTWDWSISSGVHQYYAHIFRAAYHYYYKDIKGLRRPRQNTFWRSQLRIGAWTQDKGDIGGVHQSGSHFGGLVTGVKIYRYGAASKDIYATTIHELAHSSHYEMYKNPVTFNNIESKVKESWARGVQWELTRMVYPDYKGGARSVGGNYTAIVADLIDDDFNVDLSMRNTNFGFIRNTNDQVSGYTIRQLEDALNGKKTWNSWRDNIRNKYNNETEEHLNTLFSAYE